MKLTSSSLEWVIHLTRFSNGCLFEASHPGFQEAITDGVLHPSLDAAFFRAEALIRVFECQHKLHQWLEEQRTKGLSQASYESGINLAAKLTELVIPPESDQTLR
jgi:hypothetical protein